MIVDIITDANDICPRMNNDGDNIKLTNGTNDIILINIEPSKIAANMDR